MNNKRYNTACLIGTIAGTVMHIVLKKKGYNWRQRFVMGLPLAAVNLTVAYYAQKADQEEMNNRNAAAAVSFFISPGVVKTVPEYWVAYPSRPCMCGRGTMTGKAGSCWSCMQLDGLLN